MDRLTDKVSGISKYAPFLTLTVKKITGKTEYVIIPDESSQCLVSNWSFYRVQSEFELEKKEKEDQKQRTPLHCFDLLFSVLRLLSKQLDAIFDWSYSYRPTIHHWIR